MSAGPRWHAPVSAVILSSLMAVAHAQTPPVVRGAAGVYAISDYGAVEGGRLDSTASIQKAIDVAAVKGGIVYVPPGRWLCSGSLELKMGVHLTGANLAPQSWEPRAGSILLPTAGRDREDGPAFIEMRSSTSLSNLTIYYPEQKVDDIRPYPWTIRIRANPANPREVSFDSTVQNITLINSYNGISAGPTENGRHRILGVNGCVLRRGISVDWTGDIGRIENVQFHSHFWANAVFGGNWDKVFAFMQQNLEAFIFGRTDWEYVTNTFVFPAKIGYRFIETANGACNGQFSGIGADATATALLVESIQPQGLLITNGEFDSHLVGPATQVIIAGTARGNVRFVNCGFWGPVKHNAVIDGEGFTSFSDCYFSNDNQTGLYAIEAVGGRVQIQNCTFDAHAKERKPGNAAAGVDEHFQQPSIHLGQGLRGAIVRGNNGYFGVSVANEIGSRAIISDNEPPRR